MKEVVHLGIVEKTAGTRIWVKIERKPACASCGARQYCSASDPRIECIELADSSRNWAVGEKVWLRISSSLAGKAVFLAYVLPLLVMLFVLVASLFAGIGELYAALLSILFLVAYYGILYLCKEFLRRNVRFSITLKEPE